MKKSLISLAVLALMATASTAHADMTPNDLFRFDISCTFGSVGCSADSRIFLNIRGDNPQTEGVQPEWFGNLLAVSCRGQLISASDAALFFTHEQDGVRWSIFNADRTVEIDLKDRPFSGQDKTVGAILEIRHERSSGTCQIHARDIHGLDAAGATSTTLN